MRVRAVGLHCRNQGPEYMFTGQCRQPSPPALFSHTCMRAKSLQSCLTLCGPVDCSPPGSSVRGILQARVLGWAARPASRGSAQSTDQTRTSQFYTSSTTWQVVVGTFPQVPGKLAVRSVSCRKMTSWSFSGESDQSKGERSEDTDTRGPQRSTQFSP